MQITNSIKALVVSASLLCGAQVYANTAEVSDADIVSKIKSQLAADKITSDLNVAVSSNKGIVTLTGNVSTDTEADKLIQIAGSTAGVNDVKTTELTAKESKHTMDDTAITAKVKTKYIREELFSDKDISVTGVSVETTNGVVYLTGKVATQDQAENAVKFAKEIVGVIKVESKLEVVS